MTMTTLSPENFDNLTVIPVVLKTFGNWARFQFDWTEKGEKGWIDISQVSLEFAILDDIDKIHPKESTNYFTRNAGASVYRDKTWATTYGVDLGDGRVMIVVGKHNIPLILRPILGTFHRES
jgi:hypothetical protein